MRNILAFGVGAEFVEEYSGFLKKLGFGLELYNGRSSRSRRELPLSPIVLVSPRGLGAGIKESLLAVIDADRRLPIIFLEDNNSPNSGSLKERAKYVLPEKFFKRDLANALKGSREILDLRENLESLRMELRERTLELSQVLDIGKTLASTFELPKVISKIMEHMRSMVPSEGWAVFLLNEFDQELVLEAAKGLRPGKGKKFRIKVGDGVAGRCAAERAPKMVADVSGFKGFARTFEELTGIAAQSIMAVPITSGEKLLGVIELINKRGESAFDDEDLGMVSRLLDQTAIAIERATMYQKMADLVITDDLTKLFNTRYLNRTLDIELERALRYSLSVSLIFLDLDYFKNVNDRYGHLTGSKLLVEVSQLLLKGLRKVDIVARYGGDEFVIVLPQTGVKAAAIIAERLRKSMEKNVFLRSESLALKLTASFGIACYPDHAKNKDDLIRLADEAMYRVKYKNRNNVYVVGPDVALTPRPSKGEGQG